MEPIATSEDAPISLYHDSPYSISKVIGEFYGNYYFIKDNFPIVKARFSNVYGPREILGAGNGEEQFILFGEMLYQPLFGNVF